MEMTYRISAYSRWCLLFFLLSPRKSSRLNWLFFNKYIGWLLRVNSSSAWSLSLIIEILSSLSRLSTVDSSEKMSDDGGNFSLSLYFNERKKGLWCTFSWINLPKMRFFHSVKHCHHFHSKLDCSSSTFCRIMIAIFVLILFISSTLLADIRICQCQCCRYMGQLYPNSKNSCPCLLFDQGKSFPCGGSTGIYSARICTSKIRPWYEPYGPNLCCKLHFLQWALLFCRYIGNKWNRRKKSVCHGQESNLRYPDHNRMYYHYTTAARILFANFRVIHFSSHWNKSIDIRLF